MSGSISLLIQGEHGTHCAEWQNDVSKTLLRHQYELLVAMVTYGVISSGAWQTVYDMVRQCMPCSVIFSMTMQAKILSAEPSDFLKQNIILKSFNFVL